jgi:soluble lytic murein transglycosylase
MRKGLTFIAALLITAPFADADIYARVEPNGTVSFTDTPLTFEWDLIIREERDPALAEWREYVNVAAKEANLDPRLVRAIIYVESAENPKAVSSKGAMGLMQLMPATAKSLGVKEPFHPNQNVKGGVRYFSKLMDKFDGNVRLALAAYNAGPGAVEKYGGIPPYPETRDYVRKVMEVYQIVCANNNT